MSRTKLDYHLDFEPNSLWLTVTPSKTVKSSLLHVQELGDFHARSKYHTKREGLDSYLIKYTVSGEGILDYQGQTYTVKPNQLFWIDCQDPQYYRTSPAAGNWRILWVHFNGPGSSFYYDIFQSQNRRNPVLTMPPSNPLQEYFEELFSLYKSGSKNLNADLNAAGCLTKMLQEIIQVSEQERQWSGVPDSVLQARSYLTEHYSQRITLDELAHMFSVSKFHFQKQFKHFVGYSPNEYLIILRLNHAKEFLRLTDHPVSQIACDVGIPNVSHFINLFKKQEGMTPLGYRSSFRGRA